MVIRTDGAVVEGIDLVGRIHVAANNVTIRNVRLRWPVGVAAGAGDYAMVSLEGAYSGLQVEDCEIDGGGEVKKAVAAWTVAVRRCNIYGIGDGVETNSNFVVEDNWIHGMTDGGKGWHVEVDQGIEVGTSAVRRQSGARVHRRITVARPLQVARRAWLLARHAVGNPQSRPDSPSRASAPRPGTLRCPLAPGVTRPLGYNAGASGNRRTTKFPNESAQSAGRSQ